MISGSKLVLKGLVFHWRENAGVFAGTALTAAILSGALMVGDSVRHSLVRLASQRLGLTGYAVSADERLVRSELAGELAAELHVVAAPLLRLRGLASRPDGRAAANEVQVLGVDQSVWELYPGGSAKGEIDSGAVWINTRLAGQLNVRAGDPLVLRMDAPGNLPGDAPLARESDQRKIMRLTVARVLEAEDFGNLSLRSEQIPPMNAFVSLHELSRAVGAAGSANLVLIQSAEELNAEDVSAAIRRRWTLADAGLKLAKLDNGGFELHSERVFIDDFTVESVVSNMPGATPILTYFVNAISKDEHSTPYSFVSAPGEPLVPADMSDDEIILNQWTADDLGVSEGDRVALRYYVLGPIQKLSEASRGFRVRSVVAMKDAAGDPSLMPAFPGLSGIDNCRDWNPGVEIDLEKIRDKDQAYWEAYRGTPKAFVSLEAAREMWSNRFGSATAVRFPPGVKDAGALAPAIMRGLKPEMLGIFAMAVREAGLEAGRRGVDFGQLFLGLSFFLIAAALLLTGLLYTFSMQQRAEETGLLLAIGFTASGVRRLRLAEGVFMALSASLLGAAAGAGYNRLLIRGLRTIWRDVVGTSRIYADVRPTTLVIGWLGGSLAALAAIWLALRRQADAPISAVQRGDYAASAVSRRKWKSWIAVVSLGGALFLSLHAEPGRGKEAAGIFFAAGTLALIGGLALWGVVIGWIAFYTARRKFTRAGLILSGIARRPSRSLTTVGVLAAGIFLVLAVGANRRGAITNPRDRASGTGGFVFFAESAIPVLGNLKDDRKRRELGLNNGPLADISFVQMRLRDGDDASCLNLNRVSDPPVLGVVPEEFDRRGAFSVAAMTEDVDPAHPWSVLGKELPDGTVPAIADQTVIVWGFGKSIGDTLELTDGRGRALKLKLCAGLANSVLQGHVVISEDVFLERFPDESGYRVFLVDAPASGRSLAGELSRCMRDWGLEVTPALERLQSFETVENMYLAIFLVLGGLGLGLGSLGLGIVVFRNVAERRRELAMLRSVGFSRREIGLLVIMEHMILLFAGLICGAGAAFLAVAHVLTAPGANVSPAALILPVAGILAAGAMCIIFSAGYLLRGELIPALRSE